jgi:hypothetical protein
VREDGKLGHADKATTLDAARARAGRFKVALENQVALEILWLASPIQSRKVFGESL